MVVPVRSAYANLTACSSQCVSTGVADVISLVAPARADNIMAGCNAMKKAMCATAIAGAIVACGGPEDVRIDPLHLQMVSSLVRTPHFRSPAFWPPWAPWRAASPGTPLPPDACGDCSLLPNYSFCEAKGCPGLCKHVC